jgi:DNA-directed RNA polymerase I subunit RPA2
MIRPVKQIASGAAEMIGGLEQNNMSIRVPDGGVGGTKGLRFTHAGGYKCGRRRSRHCVHTNSPARPLPTHHSRPRQQRLSPSLPPCPCLPLFLPPAEFHTGSMLSVVASLTPYSDFNQSPRNMYQCQMAKQTMGTPAQALVHRTDNKMYRIQNPQTPIARTKR